MALLPFLVEAVLISLSGVMAPGPITTVVVGKGNESPHAGALVAVGHGIVEFPLMLVVLYGAGQLFNVPAVKVGIAIAGGAFMLYMGVDMFRTLARTSEASMAAADRTPLAAGILLSLGNPYFLLWWGTVGATLVLRAAAFGLLGFLAFALAHWLCDFCWYYFLSAVTYRGSRFFGKRFQQVLLAACGAFLIFFGARFILDGIAAWPA